MAKYNTFLVVDCRSRRPLLVTSSARKALRALETGRRVEVWSENKLVRTVYAKSRKDMLEYTEIERQYIRAKQERIDGLIPALRTMAALMGFDIVGRITLRDRETGKEYR